MSATLSSPSHSRLAGGRAASCATPPARGAVLHVVCCASSSVTLSLLSDENSLRPSLRSENAGEYLAPSDGHGTYKCPVS